MFKVKMQHFENCPHAIHFLESRATGQDMGHQYICHDP